MTIGLHTSIVAWSRKKYILVSHVTAYQESQPEKTQLRFQTISVKRPHGSKDAG